MIENNEITTEENIQSPSEEKRVSGFKMVVWLLQVIILITAVCLFAHDYFVPSGEQISEEEFYEMIYDVSLNAITDAYGDGFAFNEYKPGDVRKITSMVTDLGEGEMEYTVYWCEITGKYTSTQEDIEALVEFYQCDGKNSYTKISYVLTPDEW